MEEFIIVSKALIQVTERTTTSCLEMVPSVKSEPFAGSKGELPALPDPLLSFRGQGGSLAGHEPLSESPHYVYSRSALWHRFCMFKDVYTNLSNNLTSLVAMSSSCLSSRGQSRGTPTGCCCSAGVHRLLRLRNKGKTEKKKP